MKPLGALTARWAYEKRYGKRYRENGDKALASGRAREERAWREVWAHAAEMELGFQEDLNEAREARRFVRDVDP